jgi:RHS repeat-associated protein
VTGKLYGNTWNSEKPRFYEHCNYGGTWVELPEGNYDQASMIAMGIPDNWLSSVRAGKGYQITLYEHPGYTGKQLVLTEDHPCLSSDNFNDLNSALKIERISGNLSTCTPGAGTTNTVGTLTNYGTFSFATPTFPEGTKIYNYGTLNIANFHLPNTSEIHNFSGVTSTIFDIAPTASVYSKPASRIASVNLLIRGNVEGDAFNYSEITTANTTLQSSGSVDGLIKLCATQTFQGTGTIGSAVVRDCSFDIPVLRQRTASLYQAQQGYKAYELSNHLGNVLTTISDRRIGVAGSNPALIDHYTAVILSSQDYYAFGWEMPGRKYNSTNYRYGFNGKEKDGEWSDNYNFGARIHEPRIGRFLSIDPLRIHYPSYSPYNYAVNSPLSYIDVDGEGPDLPISPTNPNGEKQVHLKEITTPHGMYGSVTSKYKVIPTGKPATKGMTDIEIYQLAVRRIFMPGLHLIQEDEYLDERILSAEQDVYHFFNSNVPAYAKNTDGQEYVNNLAYSGVLDALFGDDKVMGGKAVKQLQKARSFLYNFALTDFVTLTPVGDLNSFLRGATKHSGTEYEKFLARRLGGRLGGTLKGVTGSRDIDVIVGNWYIEAKAGGFWDDIMKDPAKIEKFKSDMGRGLKVIQEATNGKGKYVLFSNSKVPNSIKSWLNKKGIKVEETLKE